MTDSRDDNDITGKVVPDRVDTISAPPMIREAARDTIPADSPDPMIGTLLDGRYLLLSLLGEGGMGHVYRANHVLMDKPVAVKLIHAELAHMEDVAKRFEREAKSSSRLTDPHCITVTDFGRTDDGTLFLVMEVLEGDDLDVRLEEQGALPVNEALRIISQILKGLAHAHEQGVVHRDLKPENVFLVDHGGEKDFVKILDFGIAKLAAGGGAENLTKSGIVFGTPKYLSPEQALGDTVDHRVDLYAVGIMLYELLTGQPPFDAESAMDTLSMHLTKDPPSLAESGAFPRGLQEVFNKALAKKPDDRYASAEEFLAAIEALDPEGDPPSGVQQIISNISEKVSGKTSTGKKGRGGRIALIIVLLLVVAAGGLAAFRYRDKIVDEVQKRLNPEQPISQQVGDLGKKTDTVKSMLDRADMQIRDGNPAEAVVSVKEVLEISPDLAPANLLLGHGLFLSGDREAAMESYEKAISSQADLADDVRLKENLREALKWKGPRDNAALLIAGHGDEEGVELLADLCNSALTEGDVRRSARSALVETAHGDAVDWLTSLTADFHEQTKCKARKEIIAQMEETGNPGFLTLLKSYRPITSKKRWGKKKTSNACIGEAVLKAIETLSAVKTQTGKTD